MFSTMKFDQFAKNVIQIGENQMNFELNEKFPENPNTYLKYHRKILEKLSPLFKKVMWQVKQHSEIKVKEAQQIEMIATTMGEITRELGRFHLTQMEPDYNFRKVITSIEKQLLEQCCIIS